MHKEYENMLNGFLNRTPWHTLTENTKHTLKREEKKNPNPTSSQQALQISLV